MAVPTTHGYWWVKNPVKAKHRAWVSAQWSYTFESDFFKPSGTQMMSGRQGSILELLCSSDWVLCWMHVRYLSSYHSPRELPPWLRMLLLGPREGSGLSTATQRAVVPCPPEACSAPSSMGTPARGPERADRPDALRPGPVLLPLLPHVSNSCVITACCRVINGYLY